MFRPIFLMVCLVGLVCVGTARSASPEDQIKEQAKARLEVARKALTELEKRSRGFEDYSEIWTWSKRVLEARLAVSSNKNERIAAWEDHLRRARNLEQFALREYQRGGFTRLQALEAVYRRHDVEMQLAQERATSESLKR